MALGVWLSACHLKKKATKICIWPYAWPFSSSRPTLSSSFLWLPQQPWIQVHSQCYSVVSQLLKKTVHNKQVSKHACLEQDVTHGYVAPTMQTSSWAYSVSAFSYCSEPHASKCPESDFFFHSVISFIILGSSNQVRPAWTLCIWVRAINHYCVVSVSRVDLIIPSHFQLMQEAFFFLTPLARNSTGIFMGLLQKMSSSNLEYSMTTVSVVLLPCYTCQRQPAASQEN